MTFETEDGSGHEKVSAAIAGRQATLASVNMPSARCRFLGRKSVASVNSFPPVKRKQSPAFKRMGFSLSSERSQHSPFCTTFR